MPPKKIVIVGSGFAGVYAYLELQKHLHGRTDVELAMISETDAFLFVPLIHEVATGGLTPSDVMQPLQTFPSRPLHCFVRGHVASVDFDRREISITSPDTSLRDGDAGKEKDTVSYDYLISALGSETNFFNVPGAREYALTLKDIPDAVAIKNRIRESFERAKGAATKEDAARALRFVIVGAGATGLELAVAMTEYIRREFAGAFPALAGSVDIAVVEGLSNLFPALNPWFAKKAAKILARKKNVRLLLGKPVTQVTEDGVCMKEEFLPAGTIIWSAGVKARHLSISAREPVSRDERSDRIRVNAFLQIPAYPEVFIAGDQAWIADKENGQPYPMRAQFAIREGRLAAHNIVRLIDNRALEEFAWKDQGIIISLGKRQALGQICGIRFSGPLAWWINRAIYASKMIGWRARLRAIISWTLDT